MGRYYEGDISGKFWFGVQPSDDADHFGVIGEPPNLLEYYFDEDNLDDIKEGLRECRRHLRNWEKKMDVFFRESRGYNDEMLQNELNMPTERIRSNLEQYARLQLGKKILECVEEQGDCSFTAEL